MSAVREYKVEVFDGYEASNPSRAPYIEMTTDSELDVIRELLRALSDHQFHMARFVVTVTES